MPILSQTMKVVLSASLSVLAVVLYLSLGGNSRKYCMIAMLLCTAADVFMTDIIKIGSASTYPGAALFIAAHIVYFLCFRKAAAAGGHALVNGGFIAGIILTAVTAVLLGVLAFTIPDEPQPVMFVLILVYLAVIGLNLSAQFSCAAADGGRRRILFIAMTLFLVSDFTVFLPMLNICPEHNDFVWFTYLPAQLLILLFNS